MVNFPQTFAERAEPLPHIGERGNIALERLRQRGFEVTTGLTEYFAGAIGVMGYQQHIREYCPKDATDARFGTLESTAAWLQKGHEGTRGRGTFLLLRVLGNNYQLEGYGWTGYEPCDALPNHPITSAFRLGERALGQGLGKDFIQTVVSGTNTLYAPHEGIGLETWRSNHAAALYPKVGFIEQPRPEQEPELRATLDPTIMGGTVLDTRLYMAYDESLLAS